MATVGVKRFRSEGRTVELGGRSVVCWCGVLDGQVRQLSVLLVAAINGVGEFIEINVSQSTLQLIHLVIETQTLPVHGGKNK